ncbi:MAG: hypothetical protein IJA97_06410 [Clostridia bacterium]|nr:hypothetical protein [Clostridia bacterium]
MGFQMMLNLGNYVSLFINSLHQIFSSDFDTVYNFLFNGGVITAYGIGVNYGEISLELQSIDIPILSDITGGIFTLLFADTTLIGFPFYFNFIVCLARVSFFVLVWDIVSKIFKLFT